jgi:hypothetical protein
MEWWKVKRSRIPSQPALLDMPAWTKKRAELSVDKAVAAARAAGLIDAKDEAAVTAARALARGVDMAETQRDLWALATLARELRQQLERLRLDPASRGTNTGDELAELLRSMSTPDR